MPAAGEEGEEEVRARRRGEGAAELGRDLFFARG